MEGASARELWVEGARAWPGLPLEESVFVDHYAALAERAPLSLDQAGDLFLACACAHDVPGALAAFEQALGDELARASRRLAGDRSDDLAQLVRQKLFARGNGPPKIALYSGRAPLKHWLRVVVARTSQNVRRKRSDELVGDAYVDAIVADSRSPEAKLIAGALMHEYKAAFEAAFNALDGAERMLLRFSVVDELGIDEIAAILKVHRATAARRVATARLKLGELTKSMVMARGRISHEEFESAVQVIRSQLDLSLQRVFAAERT